MERVDASDIFVNMEPWCSLIGIAEKCGDFVAALDERICHVAKNFLSSSFGVDDSPNVNENDVRLFGTAEGQGLFIHD